MSIKCLILAQFINHFNTKTIQTTTDQFLLEALSFILSGRDRYKELCMQSACESILVTALNTRYASQLFVKGAIWTFMQETHICCTENAW